MHPLLSVLIVSTVGVALGAFLVGIKPNTEVLEQYYLGDTMWKRRLHGIFLGGIVGAVMGIAISGIAWIVYLFAPGTEASSSIRTVSFNFGLSGGLLLGSLAVVLFRRAEDEIPWGSKIALVLVFGAFGMGIGGVIALVIATLNSSVA